MVKTKIKKHLDFLLFLNQFDNKLGTEDYEYIKTLMCLKHIFWMWLIFTKIKCKNFGEFQSSVWWHMGMVLMTHGQVVWEPTVILSYISF